MVNLCPVFEWSGFPMVHLAKTVIEMAAICFFYVSLPTVLPMYFKKNYSNIALMSPVSSTFHAESTVNSSTQL